MTGIPLRDVITIPVRISAGDYVLKLTEGVQDAAHVRATLSDYVVTSELAANFNEALNLIKGSLERQRSDGAFLHGSFGSGKSHFMAVLHQLLGNDPGARSIDGLAGVVGDHDSWLQNSKLLRLTYHLIGATNLESAVLGGYVDQIRRIHPEAPLPEVHVTEALLDDADRRRASDGDEKFFTGLGGGETTEGWGDFGGGWDAKSYDRARRAVAGDDERGRLVSDLTSTYFQSFVTGAGYLDLDRGLAALTRHAQSLGYEGVVLFLDELVLWLASRIGDTDFVSSEGAKVAKLVEAADARRPIPLISFIARQRDLKDFLGEHVPGAERLAFGETFRWWEDRFNKITLEDRNLPIIIERRLLKPLPGGAEAIDAAFARVSSRGDVWNVLLQGLDTDGHGGADQAAFRRTYPFSPALVDVLVALSGMLQRERTALKVMQQLLVDGRNDLTVDDLIPVGDVFDVLVEGGDTPLTAEIAQHFVNAKSLYHEKIRPLLLATHRLDETDVDALPRTHAFRADDRLVKTLLLGALAPNVPALRSLTASRLAALNHGTIATPLPGTETSVVLRKLRDLAGDVGEIRLSDDTRDPVISVELARVDYESIIERVRNVDNTGERRRLLRDLVFTSLGISLSDTLSSDVTFSKVWRGSRRIIDVVFGNVRDRYELPDDALIAQDERWKLIIDFPFDAEANSPNDDHARIEALRASGTSSRTICWIPAFLTPERERDLGELVCLNHLLAGAGERFESNATHLSVQDRAQAKVILANRQSSLRQRMMDVLQQAYGAAKIQPGTIDTSYGEPRFFASLDAAFDPGAPVGARLQDAFDHLTDQMFSDQFPDHPHFEAEVRKSDVTRVLEYVARAVGEPGGRVAVEQSHRATVARICNRIKVGEMLEAHFLFSADTFPWRNHFVQQAANESLDDILPVAQLYAWTDLPRARGLDPLVKNLLVAAYALISDRAWWRGGAPVAPPSLDQISDRYELRQPVRADEQLWPVAVRRAAVLFGVHVGELRSAANLATLAAQVRTTAAARTRAAHDLVTALESHAGALDLTVGDDQGRLATARETASLVERLTREDNDVTLVEVLAGADLPSQDAVAARSLSSADEVVRAIDIAQWQVIDALVTITDQRGVRARAVLTQLRSAAGHDEHAEALAPVLRSTVSAAAALLADVPPAVDVPPGRPGAVHGSSSGNLDSVIDELRTAAAEHAGATINLTWDIEP
jgi:hypothetical protein